MNYIDDHQALRMHHEMASIYWTDNEIYIISEPSIACQKIECSFGAVCRVDNNDEPSCICDFNCPKSVKSVCGSDGLTYDSDCQRKSAQCRLQTTITLAKPGPCVKACVLLLKSDTLAKILTFFIISDFFLKIWHIS